MIKSTLSILAAAALGLGVAACDDQPADPMQQQGAVPPAQDGGTGTTPPAPQSTTPEGTGSPAMQPPADSGGSTTQ